MSLLSDTIPKEMIPKKNVLQLDPRFTVKLVCQVESPIRAGMASGSCACTAELPQPQNIFRYHMANVRMLSGPHRDNRERYAIARQTSPEGFDHNGVIHGLPFDDRRYGAV